MSPSSTEMFRVTSPLMPSLTMASTTSEQSYEMRAPETDRTPTMCYISSPEKMDVGVHARLSMLARADEAYILPRGKCLHLRDCRTIAGRDDLVVAGRDDNNKRWCNRCAARRREVCTRCLESPADRNGLSCHPMCNACAADMVRHHLTNGRAADASSCWCGSGDSLHEHSLPRDLVRAMRDVHAEERVSTWEDLLVDHCPVCMAAYHSFDGCLSLTCGSCGAVFCALCEHVSLTSRAGHVHILECPCNDTPDTYFWPSAKFERFREHRASTRLGAWMRNQCPLTMAHIVLHHQRTPTILSSVPLLSLFGLIVRTSQVVCACMVQKGVRVHGFMCTLLNHVHRCTASCAPF